jgi:Xaa-Pro aminopeptidase
MALFFCATDYAERNRFSQTISKPSPELARERDMLRTAIVTMILAAAAVGSLRAQEPRASVAERFFDWTGLQFPPEEYAARRASMLRALQATGGGVFLAPSGDGYSGGETFRPLNDFLYLTGLELPNSMLVLDADSEQVQLFAPRVDSRFTSTSRPNDFPGRLLADDPTIARASGIASVVAFDGFEPFLERTSAAGRTLRINVGAPGGATPEARAIYDWTSEQGLAFYVRERSSEAKLENAFVAVARVRMVKTPAEVTVMRRAATVTSDGIRATARSIEPEVDERTLEGILEAEFKRAGAQRVAFASIIKSGPNSLWPWRVLASHYDRRNRRMQSGDLVIFDVGAELDYYSSDVGRTFPVSGHFTAEQRDLLKMVTAVADTIIASVRPGVTLSELQRIAESAIPPVERGYMQTGLFFGHHVGLAVSDPSLTAAPLEAGMIFTVEPWYYNHDRGVAVFVEDEVLVTESGAELLTGELPRTPEGIEALMARRSEPSSRR